MEKIADWKNPTKFEKIDGKVNKPNTEKRIQIINIILIITIRFVCVWFIHVLFFSYIYIYIYMVSKTCMHTLISNSI